MKRERDRAWEQAKSSGSHPSSKPVPHRPQSTGGGGGGGGGGGAGVHAHKASMIEKGKWVEKGGEYAFVSTRGCVNETCPYTVSDDNLKAALDLPSNANDAVETQTHPRLDRCISSSLLGDNSWPLARRALTARTLSVGSWRGGVAKTGAAGIGDKPQPVEAQLRPGV